MTDHELNDNAVAVIDQIIASNERIRRFWTKEAGGRARREAATYLKQFRIAS
jgi:hypothetical protein